MDNKKKNLKHHIFADGYNKLEKSNNEVKVSIQISFAKKIVSNTMKILTINLMFSGSSIIIMVDLLSSIIHLSTIKKKEKEEKLSLNQWKEEK